MTPDTVAMVTVILAIGAFCAVFLVDYLRRRSLPGLPSRGICPNCGDLRFAHLPRCPYCGTGESVEGPWTEADGSD